MEKHNITSVRLFGAAMNQLLQEMSDQTFPAVTNVRYGGSCFPPTLVQKSMEQFPNAEFTQIYGMTEIFPIAILPPSAHKKADDATHEDLRKMSSAGLPSADVFIEDMDQPGSGLPPPPEKRGVGQICCFSPLMMSCYYKNLEKTKAALPDGKYLRTGDVGKIDEHGYVHILGRVKDIIPTYRGFNVAPRDIEEALYSHPAIAEAQVIGLLHPCGAGEMVVAWASSKAGKQLTPEAMRAHCTAAGLATWQMPEAFCVSSETLPTNGSKFNKKALQDPAFVRRALLESLGGGGGTAAFLSSDEEEEAAAAFRKLDSAGVGVLSSAAMSIVFEDLTEAFEKEFRTASKSGQVDLSGWLFALSKLSTDARTAWLLQFGSLLASRERAMLSA
eukprot:TRINITY_DN14603_c0_g2_i1.p1 TRINITY_DN14603_c0_g2~~TRINITY_DN14603_c0_g2_i1.p1  ORF type:complete len:388 (-),score=78.09 TRINITY_DN14603_c0_g2_i1:324-1487(-)